METMEQMEGFRIIKNLFKKYL